MPRARRGGTGFSFDLRSCLTICFCSLALLAAIGSKYVAENNLRPVLSLKLLSEPPREPQLEVKAVEPEVTTSETSGTLAFSPTPAPAQPLQQLQHCSTISFLRIQKTASTTFGHEMMQKMCGKRRQRCKQNWDRCAFGKQTCGVELYDYHLEYNLARQLSQMGKGRGCVVTFLRGPVERTMSEYFMLRVKHRQFLSFDQWDVHANDIAGIDAILNIDNLSVSFQQYLHHPRNPSRNRQTLYLLGFRRVECNKTRCGGNACICETENPGYPALAYDWERNSSSLLQLAKEHLRSLDAFGLVECFKKSIEAIAPLLGWDLKLALELANKQELHVWKPVMEKARQIRLSRRLSFNGASRKFWREFLHESVGKEILAVNHLDHELLQFAQLEFRSRYGSSCEEAP
ncbi:unnamed protein product [Effrenium voratum]|uniref:Uncharacterized protein n=2 Tax=Effrenium voratum TaxID=2562239 RepID=A0AA36MLR7_9DINO|nr:unnamed protein product [Effrenium voratum]CAJ1427118.1 unnamed protein product [Effrenium voratum]